MMCPKVIASLLYPILAYESFHRSILLLDGGESESKSEVAQSCPTLCDHMDCSLPGSSVLAWIFQARILEWVSFSRRSSRPRDWTQVSRVVGRHFTVWATREVLGWWGALSSPSPCILLSVSFLNMLLRGLRDREVSLETWLYLSWFLAPTTHFLFKFQFRLY